jgi:hypothetical protein
MDPELQLTPEAIESSEGVPFALTLAGEPVVLNPKVDPHLLVAGRTGSHKTVLLQHIVFGAIRRGWQTYVIETAKAGVDFEFAEEWCHGSVHTVAAAAAMLEHLHAEMVRRKRLDAEYGVESYSELPEEVRPPHIVIAIDEFASLLHLTSVPPGWGKVEAKNAARVVAGTFVGKIVREGRSAGVTIVLAGIMATSLAVNAVPGALDIRANMSRILLGDATFAERQVTLRAPAEAPALVKPVPKGRGIWEPEGGRPEVIQCWLTPPSVLEGLLRDQIEPVPAADRFVHRSA